MAENKCKFCKVMLEDDKVAVNESIFPVDKNQGLSFYIQSDDMVISIMRGNDVLHFTYKLNYCPFCGKPISACDSEEEKVEKQKICEVHNVSKDGGLQAITWSNPVKSKESVTASLDVCRVENEDTVRPCIMIKVNNIFKGVANASFPIFIDYCPQCGTKIGQEFIEEIKDAVFKNF